MLFVTRDSSSTSLPHHTDSVTVTPDSERKGARTHDGKRRLVLLIKGRVPTLGPWLLTTRAGQKVCRRQHCSFAYKLESGSVYEE